LSPTETTVVENTIDEIISSNSSSNVFEDLKSSLDSLIDPNNREDIVIVTETIAVILNYIPYDANSTKSSYEISIPGSSNSLSLELSGGDIAVLVVNYGADFFNNITSTDSSIHVNSDIISIQIINLDGSGEIILPVFTTNMSYTPQNYHNQIFNHTCSEGIIEQIQYYCTDAQITFNLTCSGSLNAQIIRECPLPKQDCSVIDITEQTVRSNDYCKASNMSGSNIVCNCGYSQNSLNMSGLNSVDVAITTSYSGGYFGMTVSGSVNGDQFVQNSSTIFLLFGGLWGCSFCIVLFNYTDNIENHKFKKKIKPTPQHKSHKTVLPENLIVSNQHHEFYTLFEKYIRRALPAEFETRDFFDRFWDNIWNNHPVFKISKTIGNILIGKKSQTIHALYENNYKHDKIKEFRKKERTEVLYDILHVITSITLSCFILALLYDFQYPSDDGTCANNPNPESCFDRKLLFDSTQTYCTWKPVASPGYLDIIDNNQIVETIRIEDLITTFSTVQQCFYNDNDSSIQATIITTVITIAASIPLDIFSSKLIDYLRATTNHHTKYNVGNTKPIKHNHFKTYQVPEELNITRTKVIESYNKLRSEHDKLSVTKSSYFSQIENKHTQFYNTYNNKYGIGIIHILYYELLGKNTYAEKLFSMYIKKTFIKHANIDKKIKWIAALLLLSINVGSLIYIAFKGVIRGTKWQHIYLSACIINWISDICCVKMIEILWTDFMVVGLIHRKIAVITNLLCSLVILLHDPNNKLYIHPKYMSWIQRLNKKRLFSRLLASIKPGLFESAIVRNIFKFLNTNEMMYTDEKCNIMVRDSFFTGLCGSIPFEIHRIFSLIFSSLLIIVFIISWYHVTSIIIIFLILLAGMIVYIGYVKNTQFAKRRRNNIFTVMNKNVLETKMLQVSNATEINHIKKVNDSHKSDSSGESYECDNFYDFYNSDESNDSTHSTISMSIESDESEYIEYEYSDKSDESDHHEYVEYEYSDKSDESDHHEYVEYEYSDESSDDSDHHEYVEYHYSDESDESDHHEYVEYEYSDESDESDDYDSAHIRIPTTTNSKHV